MSISGDAYPCWLIDGGHNRRGANGTQEREKGAGLGGFGKWGEKKAGFEERDVGKPMGRFT